MLIYIKKKEWIYLVIIILILLLMLGGYTFAKYFSKVNGLLCSDIAMWNFKINGNDEKMQNINLFDTCQESTKTNGKIAPGTEGKINIQVDATGTDVDVEYNFNFKENGLKPANFKYIYENIEYENLDDIKKYIDGRINVEESNKIRYIEIGWIWKYENGNVLQEIEKSDQQDTQDGMYLNKYDIDIIVTGKQVNT